MSATLTNTMPGGSESVIIPVWFMGLSLESGVYTTYFHKKKVSV